MKDSIEERIWNAIPVTQQALFKLLELLSIEETEEISTACVTLGTRSRLRINPRFVEKHCYTPDRLATLVMHELFHVLLGHTRLFDRVTQEQNWAFDAIINAHLSQLFPEPSQTALFRGLYKPGVFPEALLRPPEGWGTDEVSWQLTGEALQVHKSLYSESSGTYHEVFGLLKKLLGESKIEGVPPLLLGSHGEEAENGEGVSPELVQEVRNIIAEWPMVIKKSGRDQGDRLNPKNLDPRKARKQAVGLIRRAFISLLDHVVGSNGKPVPGIGPVESSLPFRTGTDRRAVVREAIGYPPLAYRAVLEAPCLTRYDKVHVYIDVSGSMHTVLPLIYGALLPLRSYISNKVHLFSTEIADISTTGLKKGALTTTGGTDIACVSSHIIDNRVRRAVIITDGWVGDIPPAHLDIFRRRKIIVNSVLTRGGDPDFTKSLRGRTYELCNLN